MTNFPQYTAITEPFRNKNDFLNIPIDLLGFALKKRLVNKVRLFIVLKSLYNGRFPFNNESVGLICRIAGYKTVKTFKTNFKWLISHKWVTFCKGYCVLKGYNKLKIDRHFNSRKGVQFVPAYDLEHFRSFTCGAVITYCMKRKRFADRESGIDKRSPIKRSHRKLASYNLPLTYLSSILNVSKTCASNYKRIAKKAGYINYKKDYEVVENVSPLSCNKFRKYADVGDKHKLRFVNDELCFQLPDIITTNMVVKTKRNLRYIS
jgi:hypothetical protein